MRARRVRAASLALLLCLLVPAAGSANQDGGNDRNEQRDTQSRNEQKGLSSIPLVTGDGLFDLRKVILIQARFVHVTDTFFQGIGVDFENLDRVDVSDVPLLGSLFDKPLRGEDFTPENRVGSVYRGADGTLVAVLDDDVDVADSEVSVVNGKGRYQIRMAPQLIEVDPTQLGELGTLESIQSLVRGVAPRETSIVIGGLTRTSVPEGGSQVPLLNDIPILQRLFRGTAHRGDDKQLMILIRPSVIIQEEDE
jgi:hypothetical protein